MLNFISKCKYLNSSYKIFIVKKHINFHFFEFYFSYTITHASYYT